MLGTRLHAATLLIGCILGHSVPFALAETPEPERPGQTQSKQKLSAEPPADLVKQHATNAITHPPQSASAGNADADLSPVEKGFAQIIAAKKFVWVAIAVAFIQGRRMLRKLEEEKAREAEEANRREAFEKPHDWRF
jgi:hypothetical protein